jgi:glycosyltransferase involved in cell wall biosynthesis
MCKAYWGKNVVAWPVGIDTEKWTPTSANVKTVDVLIYDKVLWFHDRYEEALLGPIRRELARRELSVREIRYGYYREEDYLQLVRSSRAAIFLSAHETQGLAYLQALSCGVPIFAWDRGGFWQDPAYFPERVLYEPVTSVPYWDGRCGAKFADLEQFCSQIDFFLADVHGGAFRPRDYILENLTLAECARNYIEIARNINT